MVPSLYLQNNTLLPQPPLFLVSPSPTHSHIIVLPQSHSTYFNNHTHCLIPPPKHTPRPNTHRLTSTHQHTPTTATTNTPLITHLFRTKFYFPPQVNLKKKRLEQTPRGSCNNVRRAREDSVEGFWC